MFHSAISKGCYTGCLKKTGIMELCIFCIIEGDYTIKYHCFKYLYDKIYTIGYYSGFYSSMRDQICGNGGHIESSSKDEDTDNIYHVFIKSIIKS
jgi:hypothetical protein